MKIPNDPFLGTSYIGKEEIRAVNKVLKSKSLFRYHGPNLLFTTDKFEANMAKYLGVKYVLTCSNGAAAIKLCCIANNIGPGDEVIMSPFTFIASAGSVLSCGAIPKFVDIDETMNISPEAIEKNITKKTKAILVIHMQGQPCDMKNIMKIAKKHNLIVIEDTAQALGSELNGKKVGTFGNCGAFSLQAGKTITCGEGGFLATNDKKIYLKAKMYHDNGGYRVGCDYPTWENGKTIFGENFKLTEIQSAIANEQLKKITKILKRQERVYKRIIENIDRTFYNIRPCVKGSKLVNSNISLEFKNSNECEKFIKYMNEKGIGFNIYCSNLINKFDTFTKQQSWHSTNYPYNISNYINNECTNAESLFKRVAWFNLSGSLKNKHIKYIIKVLKDYRNEF